MADHVAEDIERFDVHGIDQSITQKANVMRTNYKRILYVMLRRRLLTANTSIFSVGWASNLKNGERLTGIGSTLVAHFWKV